MFSIGVNDVIELQDSNGSNLNINFKSYLGFNSKRNRQFHDQVADYIWEEYFSNEFGETIERWRIGETINIEGYELDATGLTAVSGFKKVHMMFSEMKLLPQYDHLLIDSDLDETKYLRLYYLDIWNWPLIYDILKRGTATDANMP